MKIRTVLFMGLIGLMSISPAFGGSLYDNSTGASGGLLGSGFHLYDGWSVSDSFTLASAATISEIDFLTEVDNGQYMASVEWSISASAFGTDLGSGTVAPTVGLVCSLCIGNFYDVDTDAITGLSVSLGAGTYYLTLQDGVASDLQSVNWDQSDGPSTAFTENVSESIGAGAISSETFSLQGGSGTTPEPGTWMLFGSGLLAVAFGVRRRSAFRD